MHDTGGMTSSDTSSHSHSSSDTSSHSSHSSHTGLGSSWDSGGTPFFPNSPDAYYNYGSPGARRTTPPIVVIGVLIAIIVPIAIAVLGIIVG
jgi:hypothetical protein